MKKIIMSFCILYCMLGYNCIGLSGWLSDVTDAAVNKAKTTVNKDKSYEQERNKAIAEKITQILADIRKQLLAGNEIDVKSSFAASLSRICLSMPMPYNRLSKEEIDKYVVENQQNFDALLSERETLKQKAQKELEIQQEKIQKEREVEQEKAQKKQDGEQEKAQEERKIQQEQLKQEAWQRLLERINGNYDYGTYLYTKEKFLFEYRDRLKEISQEQFDAELKQRLENIKFTNVKQFDSRVNFYKDFSSGMSYAWALLSQEITKNYRTVYDNRFNVTSSIMKSGDNQLLLLFSNGYCLLPQNIFTKKDKEDGIIFNYENAGYHFNDELFGAQITFSKNITFDELLKKAEVKYGKFKITAHREKVILLPLPRATLFDSKSAIFENDSIKVEINQLSFMGEKVEEITESSSDYKNWVNGLSEIGRALSATALSQIYSDEEIKQAIGTFSPVKMSVYDMKRLKKLYVLYQEELNALNAKRQAKEKEAKDKDAQAKKDALSF